MDFLERFDEPVRMRLMAAATTVRLGRGETLIRRGERGGDIYRVAEGELEVIDTRSQPVVVLDVLRVGAVVGEMAFLDESTRSADVRSAEPSVVQRWERAALMALLHAEPELGAAFYQELARQVSERSRQVVANAVSGGLRGAQEPGGDTAAAAVGRAVAEGLTARLIEIEPLIRRDRDQARREALGALGVFAARFNEALTRLGPEDELAAGSGASKELHPYLMRSHLGELALDRPSGHTADPQALAHLSAGRADGDGPLGEFVDAWLLDLPTSEALRERRALASQVLLECLPPEGPVRMLVVNVGDGGALEHILPYLTRLRGEITVVDDDREALARVEELLRIRPPDLRLKLVQDDLAAVCMGRARVPHPPQDLVLLDGLVDHVPERLAASLLAWSREQLAPDGAVVVTALLPSDDEAVFRHLLAWPTVRRTRPALTAILAATGLGEIVAWEAGRAGLVLRARVASGDSTFPLLDDLETDLGPA